MAEGKGIEQGLMTAVEETRAKLRQAARSISGSKDTEAGGGERDSSRPRTSH